MRAPSSELLSVTVSAGRQAQLRETDESPSPRRAAAPVWRRRLTAAGWALLGAGASWSGQGLAAWGAQPALPGRWPRLPSPARRLTEAGGTRIGCAPVPTDLPARPPLLDSCKW